MALIPKMSVAQIEHYYPVHRGQVEVVEQLISVSLPVRNVHTLTHWSSALPSHVLQGLIKDKSLPTPGHLSRYIRIQGLSLGTLDQGTTE